MGKFSQIEAILRKVASWYLGSLFVVGMIVGGLFFFIQARVTQTEARKVSLVREINAQSAKEGILVALKNRIGIAGKALDAAKPWGNLFTIMNGIADPESFTSISIDDTGRVSATLELFSVDDAVVVIANIMSLSIEKSLKTPQMLGFTFKDDGKVQLSISFFPIFTTL